MDNTAHISIAEYLLERSSSVNPRDNREREEYHHDMLCNSLMTLLLLGATAASASLLMVGQASPGISPEVQEAIKHAVSVLDDGRLRIACLLGAFGGGVLSTLLFPLGRPKEYASKIFGSTIAGILLSPKMLVWCSWELNLDNVVCMSGIVALLSWTTLQLGLPVVSRGLSKLAGGWFKNKSEPGA